MKLGLHQQWPSLNWVATDSSTITRATGNKPIEEKWTRPQFYWFFFLTLFEFFCSYSPIFLGRNCDDCHSAVPLPPCEWPSCLRQPQRFLPTGADLSRGPSDCAHSCTARQRNCKYNKKQHRSSFVCVVVLRNYLKLRHPHGWWMKPCRRFGSQARRKFFPDGTSRNFYRRFQRGLWQWTRPRLVVIDK